MGIFGIKREKVKDIRRKRELESLKEKRRVVKAEKYKAKMSRKIEKTTLKRDLERLKAQRLEAKVSKREARSELWSIPVIGSKRRRKKQGRALSSKRRIGLF